MNIHTDSLYVSNSQAHKKNKSRAQVYLNFESTTLPIKLYL